MLTSSISLKDLVRLDRQIQRDQSAPLRQLQERDRTIGAELPAKSPRRRLRAWLDALAERDEAQRLRGVEVSIGFWLALLGLLAGVLAMSGLLLVEQQQPVNVLLFLTLFVGLQWALLLLTFIVALGLALNSDLHLPLESLNPARWFFRRTFKRYAGDIRLEQLTPAVRLLLLTWGQLFGVFFNLGALATMFVILLVVDRSFGWSSTLDISAEALHQGLQWLARPWAWWAPEATVSLELVQSTRYQALQTEFGSAQVVAMRAWWPFLVACITAYALLPRFVLWLLFYFLYRRNLNRSFVDYPGARLVLDRMNSPLVHTQAYAHESALDKGGDTAAAHALPANRERFSLSWSGALKQVTPRLEQMGLTRETVRDAGLDLAEDQQLLDEINRDRKDVIILVKSWEPPLSELGDFLRGISPKLDCYLLLMPLPGRGVKPEELTDWQQFARQGHHPRLTVVSGGDEAHQEVRQ
ncbi:DUF2868 domain-containing protein [Proteobacteria bacterium 005FR1]|nr:DUF2868 domain-containing protein [Proteobacteria bacterium 005FR1]